MCNQEFFNKSNEKENSSKKLYVIKHRNYCWDNIDHVILDVLLLGRDYQSFITKPRVMTISHSISIIRKSSEIFFKFNLTGDDVFGPRFSEGEFDD
jgi:hypothetical protein